LHQKFDCFCSLLSDLLKDITSKNWPQIFWTDYELRKPVPDSFRSKCNDWYFDWIHIWKSCFQKDSHDQRSFSNLMLLLQQKRSYC